MPKFLICDWNGAQGAYCRDLNIILINPEWCWNFEQIFGIIAHEMAHQFIADFEEKNWQIHGKRFKNTCKMIADVYNIPIEEIL